MSPVQPGAQTDASDEEAIRLWLDALARGTYSEAGFLQAVQQRFRTNPEASWEVLSHLDQYYRRGRITPETFRSIKKALAETAVRTARATSAAQSPSASVDPPAEAVSAPGDMPETGNTHEIPVAREMISPPGRAEATDRHPRRDEAPILDSTGEQPKPGSVLRKRYRLEALLGQGGTGPVFQAVDEYRLESPGNQRIAIKILHPAVVKRAELIAELRREFQDLQLLSHPNILRVFEFDRDGPLVFFTMELLNGATLSRVLQVRKLAPLPMEYVLAIVRDIGAALAYAHSRGAVHGDLKPRNIFVTELGELRLLGCPGAYQPRNATAPTDHELTLPISVSGYASCELLEGARADVRDDVFALACIVYLLLTGEHPLLNKSATEARDARLVVPRPDQLNARQWRALRAGLRWPRDERPSDVEQWLKELDLQGAATHLPPLSVLLQTASKKRANTRWAAKTGVVSAMVLAAVVMASAAAWFVTQRGTQPRVTPASSAIAPATAVAEPPLITETPAATASDTRASPNSIAPQASGPTALPPASAPAPAITSHGAAAPPSVAAASTPPAPRVAAAASSQPIIAAAKSSRVELSADTVDVAAGESSAEISVHRKGSLRGETGFTWWTESGTAKPGADFSPVVPQIAQFGDGKSNLTLSVPLIKAARTQSKSFYVVIDETEGGAALGGRTLTMVTLNPPD
jgi:serine/threonine protein kinase